MWVELENRLLLLKLRLVYGELQDGEILHCFHPIWTHMLLFCVTSPICRQGHYRSDTERNFRIAIFNPTSISGNRPKAALEACQRLLQTLRLAQAWSVRTRQRTSESHTKNTKEAQGAYHGGFQQ